MKTIFACIYGWIGWATTNVVLRPLAYIASLLGFIAGGVDAYHWIELNNLAKEFKKTGYIIVLTLSNYEQKSHCRDFVLLKALTKNIDAEVLVFFSHDCPYRLILLLTFQALNRL